MERTQAKTGQRDEQAPQVVGTLGQVVRAARTTDNPIPVAAVVSVFDDLLAGEADPPGARTPDLDDVLVDQAGVARLDIAADLRSIAGLLIETLGDDVPDAARSFIGRLKSDAADDQPADAAQLRSWMREALGQPADRSEVIALVASVASPLPVPEPASEAPKPSSSVPEPSASDSSGVSDGSQTIYDVRAEIMAEASAVAQDPEPEAPADEPASAADAPETIFDMRSPLADEPVAATVDQSPSVPHTNGVSRTDGEMHALSVGDASATEEAAPADEPSADDASSVEATPDSASDASPSMDAGSTSIAEDRADAEDPEAASADDAAASREDAEAAAVEAVAQAEVIPEAPDSLSGPSESTEAAPDDSEVVAGAPSADEEADAPPAGAPRTLAIPPAATEISPVGFGSPPTPSAASPLEPAAALEASTAAGAIRAAFRRGLARGDGGAGIDRGFVRL